MKNKIIWFLGLALLSQQGFSQTIPTGVYSELAKFPGLTEAYIQKFPGHIAQSLAEKEKSYLKSIQSSCQPKVDVQYITTLTDSKSSAAKDFESGFISIDTTFCFQGASPEKVIELYSAPEFQQSSVSTINESVRKGDLVCEKTTAPTIGNSHYCYNQEIQKNQNYIISFSFNVWNDILENADAPVYFREVVVSATQIQNNTQFHLQTLVRGPKLGFFQKIFAKGAIESEQQSVYEKMKQRLQ